MIQFRGWSCTYDEISSNLKAGWMSRAVAKGEQLGNDPKKTSKDIFFLQKLPFLLNFYSIRHSGQLQVFWFNLNFWRYKKLERLFFNNIRPLSYFLHFYVTRQFLNNSSQLGLSGSSSYSNIEANNVLCCHPPTDSHKIGSSSFLLSTPSQLNHRKDPKAEVFHCK